MPDAYGNIKGITVPRLPAVQICPRTNATCGRCIPNGHQHEACKFINAQEARSND